MLVTVMGQCCIVPCILLACQLLLVQAQEQGAAGCV
jgi:hypothetical protein